jgi:hypothetical protein
MNSMNFTPLLRVCFAAAPRIWVPATYLIVFPPWEFIEFISSPTLYGPKKGGAGGRPGQNEPFSNPQACHLPVFGFLIDELYVLWLTLKSKSSHFAMQTFEGKSAFDELDELALFEVHQKWGGI